MSNFGLKNLQFLKEFAHLDFTYSYITSTAFHITPVCLKAIIDVFSFVSLFMFVYA